MIKASRRQGITDRSPKPTVPVPCPSPTSAGGGLLAPLAAGLALGGGGALQGVALVAGKAHHVIVVEALPGGPPIDGAARVATGDRCARVRRKDTKN